MYVCLFVCCVAKRTGGQRGIVSCIAMSPVPRVYALGSYSCSGMECKLTPCRQRGGARGRG